MYILSLIVPVLLYYASFVPIAQLAISETTLIVHQNDSFHVHKFTTSLVTLFSSLILYVLLSIISHWTEPSSHQSSLSCFWQNCCVTRSDKLQFPRWRSHPVSGFGIRGTHSTLRFLSFSAIFHNCSRKQRAPTQTAVMCDLKEKNILAHSQTAPISAARELLQYMWGLWSTSCYTFKLFIVRLRVTGIVWHLKAWSFLRALFPAWLLSICFCCKLRSCGVKCTPLLPLRRNGFPALTSSSVSYFASLTIILSHLHRVHGD